jgi:hypothetical protein
MSKKQSRRNNSRRAGWRKSRVAALIILALVCVISTSLLAQVISRKAQPANSGEVSTASLTPGSPSKEMIYAGGRLIATEEPAGPICTYSIFPQSQGFTSSGGTGGVSVTAGAGCGWTAGSNASFLTITSGSSGSGNGTVNYSVASNSGAFRSGTLTIAGLTFTVNQDAATPLYEGWLDGADCNTIFGWAADINRLNTSISVDIYDGTAYLTTVLANQYRPDIAAYLGDNGLHGFSFATPASLKNGQPHSVFVKFSGTSTNLSGTPKSITCVVLPNAPSSLAATAASSSQINLTWADNSTNETGFKLERKTGSGGVYSQIATPLVNATSHPDTGLAASTTYFYRIRATNSAGDSAYSNEASATTSTAGGAGTGLKGEYFTNRTLTGPPAVTRVDPTINLAWGTGSPDPAIPIDQFSVLWTGQVQAQFSQTYTFYVFSDDGIRMWVNGQLLIDRWFDQYGPEVASAPIALIAGQKYDIRIEYYEAFGGAELHLSWSSASTAKQIVPQSQLFPPAASGNYSLSLNGAGAYVSVPDSNSLDITGPFTVEAWVKTNTPTATQQGIVERYRTVQGIQDGGFALRLSNGRLQFWSLKNGFDLVDVVEGNSVIPTGWHHVAGVWDGSELRVYMDGVLNGFKASTFAPAAGTMNLKIGARGDDASFPFNGLIDEVRITASALYTGQSFTVERQLTAVAGTRALWKFDGQSTSDASGNGNTGTLVSGAGFSADVPTSACVSPVASAPTLQSDTVWVEDAPPAGAIVDGNWGAASWRWDTRQKASGTQSHTDPLTGGIHQHYFYNAPLTTSLGEKLVCYVLVNPCNPPREVMLQWLGPEGTFEHRAFWGENLIGWGTTGTGSRLGMGALPQAGAWVRLEVPTSSVGLSGATINGVAFTLYDGQACFDRVGKATGPPLPTNNASFVSQTPPPLQMSPSQTASVSVTMQNTGTTTWTAADGYKLGSQNPQDNLTWGLSREVVPNSVAPGAQVTFNFSATAPATTGTYNFQWQMLREGVEWFGSPTTNMAITVSSGGGGGGSCSQVTVFSGSGIGGYLEGLGTAARWYFPYDGVVGKDPVSALNALFVADTFNHRIRMVYLEGANAGLSILIAGSGTAGYWEGDGDPYQARYNLPTGLAVIKDAGGIVTTLLVVDGGNNMIRKLDRPLSGSVWRPSWLSGQTGAGYADGPPDQTQFFFPRKAVVGLDGFIYVTDSMNNRIRKLNLAGNSSTLATGINTPVGITVSRTTGVLYLTENGAPSIWSLTTAGTANRIAGNGTAGVWDGTGAAARFSAPDQLDWTNAGGSEVLYIGDRLNHEIRKLAIATTVVTTYAGSGTAGYVNGSCSAAQFNNPRGVPIGPLGEIYVIDSGNYRIRKVQ